MKSNNTLTLHFQCKKPNAKSNIFFIAKLLIKLKINKFSLKTKRMVSVSICTYNFRKVKGCFWQIENGNDSSQTFTFLLFDIINMIIIFNVSVILAIQ